MNLKLKIRFNAKTKMFLKCLFYTILICTVLLTLLTVFLIIPTHQDLQVKLTPVSFLLSIFMLFISCLHVYRLCVFRKLNKIMDQYNNLANKITERYLEKNNYSLARLSLEINDLEREYKFNKSLFSIEEINLIEIPRSSVFTCYESLKKSLKDKQGHAN